MRKSMLLLSSCLLAAPLMATEVNINPIGAMLGKPLTLNVLFDLHEKVKLGPQLGYMHVGLQSISLTAFEVGARAEWAQHGFTRHGYYLASAANYLNASNSMADLSCQFSAVTGSSLVGHAWRWQSGINIKVGAGLQALSYLDSGLSCANASEQVTLALNEQDEPIDLQAQVELALGFGF